MRKIDPEKQEAKRRHIIDAAATCFAQKGFHATSTNEICIAAGMSPGNLFHYFPNKQALITAIAEEDRADMVERFTRLAKEDNVMEAIEQLTRELLALYANPVYVRISLEVASEAIKNSDIGQLFLANEVLIKAQLTTLLERGKSKGQIDPSLPTDIAATWLIALADGALGRALIDRDFQEETYAPVLMQMIRRFLAPPAASY